MAYTANVPVANQLVSQSQPIINANFQALAPFGNGYAELTNQLVAPTIGAGNDGIYTLNYATTGKNEAFIHRQTFAGTADTPFTASKMSNTATASCLNGWAYLPNGMLIKWGKVLAPSAVIFTVNVASLSGGPAYTQVFQTYLTSAWGGSVTNSASIPITAASGTTLDGNFTAFVTNFDATRSYFTYLVIGV